MLNIDWADAAEQLAEEDDIDQVAFLEAFAFTLRDELRTVDRLETHLNNIRDYLSIDTITLFGFLAKGGDLWKIHTYSAMSRMQQRWTTTRAWDSCA